MLNRIYERIKEFILESKFFLILIVIIICLFNIKLPYYIYAPGGIIDLEKIIEVDNSYEQTGSINLTYVSQYDGTIPMVLFSFFLPNYDLEKKEEILYDNQTIEEYDYLNKLLLKSSNNNAVIAAYNLLEKDNNIKTVDNYVGLILDKTKTTIEIGDKVVKVDGFAFDNIVDYKKIIQNKSIGDKINITVLKEGKEKIRFAEVFDLDGEKTTGLYIVPIIDSNNLDNIKFKFKESESGPSGGLMLALSIYDKLTKEDLTKGRKIAGTGTIESDGTVGEISGIKYKIIGAAKKKVDLFFVPKENYKKALEIVNQKNYNIKLYPVSNIKEALEILKKE